MRKADLLALAARVEAAKGPDRALDGDIAVAMGWEVTWVEARRHGGRYWRRPDCSWTHEDSADIPAYTASLDAAASLVPSGWDWCRDIDLGVCCYRPEDRILIPGRAATPALALTAAALRARAAEAGDAE